ncbi:hypothetical protein PCE1_001546 [Barthelona sp. PCE]
MEAQQGEIFPSEEGRNSNSIDADHVYSVFENEPKTLTTVLRKVITQQDRIALMDDVIAKDPSEKQFKVLCHMFVEFIKVDIDMRYCMLQGGVLLAILRCIEVLPFDEVCCGIFITLIKIIHDTTDAKPGPPLELTKPLSETVAACYIHACDRVEVVDAVYDFLSFDEPEPHLSEFHNTTKKFNILAKVLKELEKRKNVFQNLLLLSCLLQSDSYRKQALESTEPPLHYVINMYLVDYSVQYMDAATLVCYNLWSSVNGIDAGEAIDTSNLIMQNFFDKNQFEVGVNTMFTCSVLLENGLKVEGVREQLLVSRNLSHFYDAMTGIIGMPSVIKVFRDLKISKEDRIAIFGENYKPKYTPLEDDSDW